MYRSFWHKVTSLTSKSLSKGVATVIAVLIVVSTISYAGSLTPPGSVSATFYTLTDIYDLINSNTTTTAGNHDFTFSDSLSGSGYTLTQVYDALTGLVTASNVLLGTTYLGVAGTYDAINIHTTTVRSGVSFGAGLTGIYPSASAPLPDADGSADLEASGGNFTTANGAVEWWHASGTRYTATLDFPTLSNVCPSDTSNGSTGTLTASSTVIGVGSAACGTSGALLANMFNGTGGGLTGGSQAEGGVHDYVSGGSPPSDRYAANWTICTAGNSYCGTGDTIADAKDEFTGLIWSLPCNGVGCASYAEPGTGYSWHNTGGNNNSRTAYELCSDRVGWALPHQKQLMQAYVNGSYGNLNPIGGTNELYWSATTASDSSVSALAIYLNFGGVSSLNKTSASNRIRCVWVGS